MTRYNDAFMEVSVILDSLVEEDFNKIPLEVIDAIYENRNMEYEYELDEDVDLSEQPMLPETKAILFNLFRDYLSTDEQREKIIRMQKEERTRNEEKKRLKYSTDVFENNNNSNKMVIEEQKQQNTELYPTKIQKEGIFKRIINFIKNIFKK